MVEMSIWVPILLVEAWLLSSGVLGFLVWQARRRQRRLRTEVEALQRSQEAPAEAVQFPDPAPTPASAPLEEHQDQPDDPEAASPFTALFQTNVDLEEAAQHFREKAEALQRLLDTIHLRLREADDSKKKIPLLERMLRDAKGAVTVLQRTDAYMQQHLRKQDHLLRKCADELSWSTRQRVLLEATIKELRTANAQLAQEIAVKDILLRERHVHAQPEETRSDEASEALQQELQQVKTQLAQYPHLHKFPHRQLQQELQQVKTQLARREAEFADLQAQYKDLSLEYRRLFSSLRS